MEEGTPSQTAAAALPESVGESLSAARAKMGLSLSEIASRTRIPLRHLEAIEGDDYTGLPSPTYATGFVRGYARAVGADEVALGARARTAVAQLGRRTPAYVPYEAADPARVPSRAVALGTLGLALFVILLAGLWYGTDLFRRSTAGPVIVPVPAVAAATGARASGAATAVPAPAPAGGPQVALTTTDRVWIRVHDGNKTLFSGTMTPGQRFAVPADAKNPMVDVGRPDKLNVTLNGSALPPLGASSRAMTNVRISEDALKARLDRGKAGGAGAAQ